VFFVESANSGCVPANLLAASASAPYTFVTK